MTKLPEDIQLCLKRCRSGDAGYPFGLLAGDLLIGLNGAPWRGSAIDLHKTVSAYGQQSLLTFLRKGGVFSILTERADLGLWEMQPVQADLPDLPAPDKRLRSWDVMADRNGIHDLFPVDASLLALVAPPVWLAQSRLWSGLAVFVAVIVLSLPVGLALVLAVWLVAGLHLWRDGAQHQRVTLQMQGFVRRGILAATSESEAVALWCQLYPETRFCFADTRPLGLMQSEPS